MVSDFSAPDPFAYEPDDSVGICLDVDGTLHRGSIFVETLAYLPYVGGVSLTADERAARREALLAIAEYGGGRPARDRWRRALTVLDGLSRVGGGRLAAWIAGRLASVDPDREGAGNPPDARDRPDYETLQARLLSAYGEILAGRSRADVDRAVARVVDSRIPVVESDRRTLAAVDDRAGVETMLVTHAPDGIARAYAERLLGSPDRVVGTRFPTDEDGRYLGTYEKLDKGTAVEGLIADRGWEYVVAAGDSGVDLAMAERANLFLAVLDEGDLAAHLGDCETVPTGDPDHLRAKLGDGRRIVAVESVVETVDSLAAALSAVGIED